MDMETKITCSNLASSSNMAVSCTSKTDCSHIFCCCCYMLTWGKILQILSTLSIDDGAT